MSRILLMGDEISVPTTTGTATSFSSATVVRLFNNSGSTQIVTVVETQGGTRVGTFSLLDKSTELLEKKASHCVYTDGQQPTIKGAKVGFTG